MELQDSSLRPRQDQMPRNLLGKSAGPLSTGNSHSGYNSDTSLRHLQCFSTSQCPLQEKGRLQVHRRQPGVYKDHGVDADPAIEGLLDLGRCHQSLPGEEDLVWQWNHGFYSEKSSRKFV